MTQISGATITSSIVYEGFNRGKQIFKQMQPLPPVTSQISEAVTKPAVK